MEPSSRSAQKLLWFAFPPFIVFGVLGIVAPRLLAGFVNIALTSPTALADFRLPRDPALRGHRALFCRGLPAGIPPGFGAGDGRMGAVSGA